MKYTYGTYDGKLSTGEPVIQLYVEQEIEELITRIGQNETKIHPVCLSAIGHYNFLRIHPFADGNGRVARLFGNILLLRGSFTPAVIYPKNKEEYIEALRHGDKEQNITPMIKFLAQNLQETQTELIDAAYVANSKGDPF